MPRLLVVLAPPRSFASIVPAMLGRHPEAYGFPELQLLLRETLGEVLAWSRAIHRDLGPPGLLRAICELVLDGQTPRNVLTAANWIEDHAHLPSREVLTLLMDLAARRTGALWCVEKTPALAFLPPALDRVREAFPDALYLHVTRHPGAVLESMRALIEATPRIDEAEREARLASAALAWPVTQRNILDFCATLAPGQFLRVRGEDVLEDPAGSLRQVAAWMGLRTDEAAVAAMLRPEEGPFARPGPINAAQGHDPRFLTSPVLRPGRPRTPPLDRLLASRDGEAMGPARRAYLAQMAHCLGYA